MWLSPLEKLTGSSENFTTNLAVVKEFFVKIRSYPEGVQIRIYFIFFSDVVQQK